MRILNTISAAFLLWVAASYIDIVTHNLTSCTYAAWNFFTLVF